VNANTWPQGTRYQPVDGLVLDASDGYGRSVTLTRWGARWRVDTADGDDRSRLSTGDEQLARDEFWLEAERLGFVRWVPLARGAAANGGE
jgi:hypothetical protein